MDVGQQINVVSASLIAAGRGWFNGRGVGSLRTGEQDETLQAMVERYAARLGQIGYQDGHRGWEGRFQTLCRELPDFTNFQEITTESWRDKSSEEQGAFEAWNSWQQSPGHWSVANGDCAIWGYAMGFCRRNTTWYPVGICADRRGWMGDGQRPEQTGRCWGALTKS